MLLGTGRQPVLDVGDPALDLPHVEVGVSGEVLADGGVGVAQGAVKGGAAQTDNHGDEAEQEEEEAGVSAAHLCEEEKMQGGSHTQTPAGTRGSNSGSFWTAVSLCLAHGLTQYMYMLQIQEWYFEWLLTVTEHKQCFLNAYSIKNINITSYSSFYFI